MNSKDSRYRGARLLRIKNPRRPDEDVDVLRPDARKASSAAAKHVLSDGERLDHLAYAYYGNAGKWWVLADAAEAIYAEELEVPGQALSLPRPPKK